MCGSKKAVEIQGRGRLPNERLYDLYFSQNVILVIKSRMVRWAGEEKYTVLMRKPEGKRPLGRPGCRWY